MRHVALVSLALVAITVSVHAAGFALLLRSMLRSHANRRMQAGPTTWLLIRTTWWLILIHVAEIAVWALFYDWRGCLPDFETALYFSGITYTTVGFGDIVLPEQWRLLAPLEALTGILMCGLSTGFFFAVVAKIFSSLSQPEPK